MDRVKIESDLIHFILRQAFSKLEKRGELKRGSELFFIHGDMGNLLQLRIQDTVLKVLFQDRARLKNFVHLLCQIDARENTLIREILAIQSTFE